MVYYSPRCRLACTSSIRRTLSLVSILFRREARTDVLPSPPLPAFHDSFHWETLSCYSLYCGTSELWFLRISGFPLFAKAICEPPCQHHHSCFRRFHNILFLLTRSTPAWKSRARISLIATFATGSCSLLIVFLSNGVSSLKVSILSCVFSRRLPRIFQDSKYFCNL